MADLSRAIVTLASRSLGVRRRCWAMAMQAELEAAIECGRPLGFALGCLVAAWRELPHSDEGRFTIGTYALAVGLIVPVAACALGGALLGYPYLAFGHAGFGDFLAGRSDRLPLLNAGTGAVAPALALLVLLLATGQLLLAWAFVGRNWARVGRMTSLNAATVLTLAILVGLVGLSGACLLLPATILIAETIAMLTFARWHDRLSGAI